MNTSLETLDPTTTLIPNEQQEIASFAFDPLNHAAISLEQCSGLAIHQELGFAVLAERLAEVTRDIKSGDTQHIQAMLFSQSVVLDAIFSNLLRRGLESGFGGIKEPMLRLALQAQKQSRQTLGVLTDLHKPRSAVLVQNNHAQNQQINNGNPNKLLNMETCDG